MATNPTRAMNRRFEDARRAIEGARAEEAILARLRLVGFTPEKLREGEILLEAVRLAMAQVDEALAAQRESTRALRRTRSQLDRAYRDAVQLVRALMDPGHAWLDEAGAGRKAGDATSDGSLDALLARSTRFFEAARRADPAVQAELSGMGLGPLALEMGMALSGAVQSAYQAQQVQMKKHHEAVTVRAGALEALDEWMRAYVAVARVALRDRPDALGRLGISPRGRPARESRAPASSPPRT